MHKTAAKIESMSTTEWHQYHQLLENRRLMDYFADEILRFAHAPLKPDDVLRRFSLNGDGQLDLKEFQLAVKRIGIVAAPSTSATSSGVYGSGASDSSATLRRSKELFSVFCPSNNKKLDVDMFCRIMTEWSLQIMRAQLQSGPSTAGSRTAAPIPTPYAVESAASASAPSGVVSSEGEAIWRRIRDAVVHNLDKLGQIFFKMDITSSGNVSQDEFELAMSHIGVFLTAREYERLYEALPLELKDFRAANSGAAAFMIRYADFLASVQGQHPQAAKHTLPASAQTSSPPIATNARLWDMLVLALDRLEPLIHQYERAHQRYVSAETFRDMLLRCSIAMSNPDYAALRVRLLPFSDSNGAIGLSALLHALRAHDRSAMVTAVRSSTIADNGLSGAPTISPIRTGRRTVFPQASEPPSSASSSPYAPQSAQDKSHAAGKSNEQRNVEANRSIVKVRDETRWKSDLNFPTLPSSDQNAGSRATVSDGFDGSVEDGDASGNGGAAAKPLALERRILTKLQQLKDVGQLGSSSPQSVFPGDRFGRITRGQFRQSLVHLSVLARYAEVEMLFWTLDPNGRGYIVNQDFYDHLNVAATKLQAAAATPWSLPSLSQSDETAASATATSSGRLPRSVQKIFEGMLAQLPQLLSICQRCDLHRTGLVSRGELTAAIQEVGVLASPQEVQTALAAITQRVELLYNVDQQQHPQHIPITALPPAEPYHPSGVVYSKLEARLKQLCSDLLSPKKRRQHLSTASVLLAPQEHAAVFADADQAYNMNMASETDALWNCPRRKMNQDHRAMKTSIKIADQIYDDVDGANPATSSSMNLSGDDALQRGNTNGAALSPNSRMSRFVSDAMDKRQRGHRLAMIAILQDLLERRGELKSVMDLHRNADVHGQVTKGDLLEILVASRLNLHFAGASSSSPISVREFVDVLYPQSEHTVNFLDLLHRVSDLLSELTRATPVSANPTGIYGNNAYPRDVARRMNAVHTMAPYSPIVPPRHKEHGSASSGGANARTLSLFASDELSFQRKLLYESRLKDLLTSDKGRQSAAILVRHAYKGVTAREMIVPIENGEFEAVCRTSDLKHVCIRLGLDLDMGELHFLTSSLDLNQSGYVSSPQLLQFFTHLATRGHAVRSIATPQGSDHSAATGMALDAGATSTWSPRTEVHDPSPDRQHYGR